MAVGHVVVMHGKAAAGPEGWGVFTDDIVVALHHLARDLVEATAQFRRVVEIAQIDGDGRRGGVARIVSADHVDGDGGVFLEVEKAARGLGVDDPEGDTVACDLDRVIDSAGAVQRIGGAIRARQAGERDQRAGGGRVLIGDLGKGHGLRLRGRCLGVDGHQKTRRKRAGIARYIDRARADGVHAVAKGACRDLGDPVRFGARHGVGRNHVLGAFCLHQLDRIANR